LKEFGDDVFHVESFLGRARFEEPAILPVYFL